MADDTFANADEWGFETRAIRAGQPHDPVTGAVVTPLNLATTYAQEQVGTHRGFEYSRSQNPTRQALENNLASLEGAEYGFAFASGLAAEDNVLRLLEPTTHLVLGNDAYGGTFRLIDKIFGPTGLRWSATDLGDLNALEASIQPATTMVWLETPTNPLLAISDIAAIAEIAHKQGALVVVDNTFATPYLQQPLSLGADIVVHSTTKYAGGHSDVVGGFVATNDPAVAERIEFTQNASGAVPSPFDCWLLMRGLKTLAIRMDRQCANSRAIVELLDAHPRVTEVLYPGLESHRGHEVAAAQMSDFGAMVSFRTGDKDSALRVAESTQVFTLAESLGAVE
ncbi:MAG: aminotransferase class V-fold PLP-dependent enzyme, partial [Acidobacteria bacterium]|nr:aminotransferase class V-fold PLP-dependent enzyme [Acidobacteriota bacterium]